MKYVHLCMVLVLLVILACMILASCDDEQGYWYSFFHMEIDSLSAPAEIIQTDTLRITFYSVPLDCCHNFYRYDLLDSDYMDNRLRLRIFGRITHNLACMCQPRVIEMEYEVTSMLTGYYYIEVVQLDDSVLRDSVLVQR